MVNVDVHYGFSLWLRWLCWYVFSLHVVLFLPHFSERCWGKTLVPWRCVTVLERPLFLLLLMTRYLDGLVLIVHVIASARYTPECMCCVCVVSLCGSVCVYVCFILCWALMPCKARCFCFACFSKYRVNASYLIDPCFVTEFACCPFMVVVLEPEYW